MRSRRFGDGSRVGTELAVACEAEHEIDSGGFNLGEVATQIVLSAGDCGQQHLRLGVEGIEAAGLEFAEIHFEITSGAAAIVSWRIRVASGATRWFDRRQ